MYEQRYELRAFLVMQKEFRKVIPPEKVPDMRFYEKDVFEPLHSLKWLKFNR